MAKMKSASTDLAIQLELSNVDFKAIDAVRQYVYKLTPQIIIDLVNDSMGYKMLDNSETSHYNEKGQPVYNYSITKSEPISGWDVTWFNQEDVECSILISSTSIYTFNIENVDNLKENFKTLLSLCPQYEDALRAKCNIQKIGKDDYERDQLDRKLKQEISEVHFDSTPTM